VPIGVDQRTFAPPPPERLDLSGVALDALTAGVVLHLQDAPALLGYRLPRHALIHASLPSLGPY